MEDKKQNTQICIYCKEIINIDSLKCQHCGNYQNLWKNWLSYSPLIISVVMMIIAIMQMSEAKKERISATVALKAANEAKSEINDLLVEAKNKTIQIGELKKQITVTIEAVKNFGEALAEVSMLNYGQDNRELSSTDLTYKYDLLREKLLKSLIQLGADEQIIADVENNFYYISNYPKKQLK